MNSNLWGSLPERPSKASLNGAIALLKIVQSALIGYRIVSLTFNGNLNLWNNFQSISTILRLNSSFFLSMSRPIDLMCFERLLSRSTSRCCSNSTSNVSALPHSSCCYSHSNRRLYMFRISRASSTLTSRVFVG